MIAVRALVLFALVLAAAVPAVANPLTYVGGPVESFVYNAGDNDAG